MVTQDEAVKAVDLMIRSLNEQAQKFPTEQYLLVSREIGQHLSDYAFSFSGRNNPVILSGDEFNWKGFKCKVA